MNRADRRKLVLVLLVCGIWWTVTLARGCDGGRPGPMEWVAAEQRDGQQ
jgi:hypothetical protein